MYSRTWYRQYLLKTGIFIKQFCFWTVTVLLPKMYQKTGCLFKHQLFLYCFKMQQNQIKCCILFLKIQKTGHIWYNERKRVNILVWLTNGECRSWTVFVHDIMSARENLIFKRHCDRYHYLCRQGITFICIRSILMLCIIGGRYHTKQKMRKGTYYGSSTGAYEQSNHKNILWMSGRRRFFTGNGRKDRRESLDQQVLFLQILYR